MSEKLVNAWYQGHWALILLAPLSMLYRLITTIRRIAYRRGWFEVATFPLPVIVIGNITVGGTGKTPLTLALVKHLQAQGFRPAIVSRVYVSTNRCSRCGCAKTRTSRRVLSQTTVV